MQACSIAVVLIKCKVYFFHSLKNLCFGTSEAASRAEFGEASGLRRSPGQTELKIF